LKYILELKEEIEREKKFQCKKNRKEENMREIKVKRNKRRNKKVKK
jgi:hypothetical protein